MSFGPNGDNRVCSLRKIMTRLHGTYFCISSARFALSFVRQPNGPKCIQIVKTHQNMSLESNGVDRVHSSEKFRRDFVARTFALAWPVLHLVLLRTQTIPNASK